MNGSASTSPQRLFFLDWLRIAAFIVLVFFHVGMYYVSWDFHVKSPFAGRWLEPWMKLTELWRMLLLFMVSGVATAHMLKAGATGSLQRERSKQLLLPLLCGVVLVVPPQSYFEVVQKFGYAGSYLDFLGLYFTHYQGFCQNGHCLILPTWNHLWFLPYLWVYTLVLWVLVMLRPSLLESAARLVQPVLVGIGLMVLPIALIFLARMTLASRFPSTHALFGDWFNHAMYFGMFLVGAVFASAPVMWARLALWRWPALVVALVCWAVLVGLRPGGLSQHLVIASLQWLAVVAAFGFAQCLLNFDHPIRQRLTQAVFPVYILHQTVIIVLTQLLLPLHWVPLIEAPILVSATFLLSYAGYELVRRISFLKPWFGLRTHSLAAP